MLKFFLMVYSSFWASVLMAQTAIHNPSHTDTLDSLTFEKALEWALKTHPDLEAKSSSVSAREAGLSQASKGLNPEIGIEIEDIAGTGEYRGVHAAQSTMQISQAVEWGGKRGSRKQVATLEKNLAQKELEQKRIEIEALVYSHYMEALFAQRRLALAAESHHLSKQLMEAVMRRVKAGATSMADEIRARLAVTEAEMEMRQDSLRLKSVKKKLSLLYGDEKNHLAPLQDKLENFPKLFTLDALTKQLEQSPVAVSQIVNVNLAEAQFSQQQSLSRPDITFSAGVRHIAEPGDIAWLAGISMPLPLLNRNQGGKAEAKYEIVRAKAEKKAMLLELKSALEEMHKNLLLTQDEIETVKEKLIPDAEKAAKVLEEGYQRGRFGIVEVLNAKADWFHHRLRYLECLLRYQISYAQLNRLVGKTSTDEFHGKEN